MWDAEHIKSPKNLNLNTQLYRNYQLRCMNQITTKAARFSLFGTKQNIWIPRRHLDEKMNIKGKENLDYIFARTDVSNKLANIITDLLNRGNCNVT